MALKIKNLKVKTEHITSLSIIIVIVLVIYTVRGNSHNPSNAILWFINKNSNRNSNNWSNGNLYNHLTGSKGVNEWLWCASSKKGETSKELKVTGTTLPPIK